MTYCENAFVVPSAGCQRGQTKHFPEGILLPRVTPTMGLCDLVWPPLSHHTVKSVVCENGRLSDGCVKRETISNFILYVVVCWGVLWYQSMTYHNVKVLGIQSIAYSAVQIKTHNGRSIGIILAVFTLS